VQDWAGRVAAVLPRPERPAPSATPMARSKPIDTSPRFLSVDLAQQLLLDAQIAAAIAADANQAAEAARLQTVPGVGPVVAHTLAAEFPNSVGSGVDRSRRSWGSPRTRATPASSGARSA